MLDIGWQTETLLNNCSWLAYTKTKRNCSHWEFFLYSVFFNHYLTQDNSFQFTQIHLNPTPIPSSKRTLNTITLSKKIFQHISMNACSLGTVFHQYRQINLSYDLFCQNEIQPVLIFSTICWNYCLFYPQCISMLKTFLYFLKI